MNSMEYSQWIMSLKADDSFLEVNNYRWGSPTLNKMTVLKVTAKRIEFTNREIYNRENGKKIGERYKELSHPATEEEIQDIKKQHSKADLIKRIKEFDFKEVEFSKLVDIGAILGIGS